ncbi:MAG: hypothetical protein ACI9QL_002657 [Candidatus Omnitrophota bacterium]|jgi:hypothetical protein
MKEKKSFMINLLGCGLVSTCLFMVTGCETTGGGEAEPTVEAPVEAGAAKAAVPAGAALVDQVDKEFNYVIIKTSAKVKAGKEFDVYRGDQVVGKVKCDGTRSGDFVSADIVDGDIKVGDSVRLK